MQLVYSEAELLRSHDYARPHVEAGRRLHGGFDAAGYYIPPRTRVRGPAIEAWTAALRGRGGDLLAADASLLGGLRYPNESQMKFLLQAGLGQTWWNTLTITGMIEGRGLILAEMSFPELQDSIEEDISRMGIGHLNKGLLYAHGIDEGGEPKRGVGGHDVMWFALRDLAFGEVDYPEPEVPPRIMRPDDPRREFAEIDAGAERLVSFLLNLLLIEFRAEIGFAFAQRMLRDPELFIARRAQAEAAAVIVDRIRADEEIHVTSLRLYLGELRSVNFRARGGGRRLGSEIIDPFWERIVNWATLEQPRIAAQRQRQLLTERILRHADGKRLLARFDALG